MTGPRDLQGEMRKLLLDRDTADRLLSGSVAPDDAPPGYAGVAGLLRSCTRLSTPDGKRERATILAMTETIRSRRSASPSVFGRAAARRPLRLKLVGVGVGAMLVGTSGLAFAGELPAPAQRIAHTVFASIGVDIPTPDAPASPEGVPNGSEPPRSVEGSPIATKGDAISSIARNHVGRAGAHGAHGVTVSTEASDGHSQAGQPHGQSEQPHGQSGQPHGQSEQPHGQSGQPHGQPAQPHGQSGQPLGQSEGPHGNSGEPHGHSDATHPA
ncbi:MAG: hypothetical protein ABI595_14020 [Actinomycetota bacterium]